MIEVIMIRFEDMMITLPKDDLVKSYKRLKRYMKLYAKLQKEEDNKK